ncbi:hypothetical protein FBY21_2733 [Pseudomonas sp. SLBN-26]|uniref:Uncharacterized protein n=1 Tax=Metapseudomonas otitidis TaxID=319939 RepID=A0A6S5RQ83_9GAMM|nr:MULTISPECIES: hypothetical protein [Pseudomonas]MCP1618115.1 hypothetical protein [Pseudomonas otitidis]TQL07353.1 hypothetical protein FBY21_2733 [Pseudomonas sp. SLBN-26]BBT15304.1 hypothetical protein WP8S17C03_13530 [Pseudomonas otitidis]
MTRTKKLCLALLACAFAAAYITLLQSPFLNHLAEMTTCQGPLHACYRPAVRL